jgi:hypothetical protein
MSETLAQARHEFTRRALNAIAHGHGELARASADMLVIKRMSELAHLGLLMRAAGAAELSLCASTLAPQLIERAWEALERGDRLTAALGRSFEIASAYRPFLSSGLRNHELERRLAERRCRIGSLPMMRTLAVLELITPEDIARAHGTTWLARRAPPWHADESVLYETTHATMELVAMDCLAPPERDYLRRWVPVWSRHEVRSGNFDLLAELMMTASCVDVAIVEADWRELFAAQGQDGTVLRRRGVEDGFVANHHSTIVAVMACLFEDGMVAHPLTAPAGAQLVRRWNKRPGERVLAGEVVAELDSGPLCAPVTGRLVTDGAERSRATGGGTMTAAIRAFRGGSVY